MVPVDKVALALSDPIRIQILDLLVAGRSEACCSPENPATPVALCSCDILPALELAPSRLSYHMSVLRDAGLITEKKHGRWVYFSLNRPVLSEFLQALSQRYLAEPATSDAASCMSLCLVPAPSAGQP